MMTISRQRRFSVRRLLTMAGMSMLLPATSLVSSGKTTVQTLIDFRNADMIGKITRNAGVTVRRTDDNMLEVRVRPFSEHGNKWPLIAFGPGYFGHAVNLATASRLETVLHHQSEGMARVDLQVGTSPDMTRGVDNHVLLVPAHTRMDVRMPIPLIRNNDPSEIAVIQMIFRPREHETVFRIEPFRLVYDPAVGSPAEDLVKTGAMLREKLDSIAHRPVVKHETGQASTTSLARRIDKLNRDIADARARQFFKSYRSLLQRIDATIDALGRLRFTGTGMLWAWQPDRYPNIRPRTGPGLDARPLERLVLSMARNECRDCVVTVAAPERDLSLTVALRFVGPRKLPAAVVAIRRTAYLKGTRKEATGDALLRVDGPVSLPAGEARQLWIRFDTRTKKAPPGRYAFELTFRDEAAGIERVIPGELTVWDIDLPGYDVLPNNSYAIFGGRLGSGAPYRQAIQDMKLYGLNHVYIEPPALPCPTGLDEHWRITGYEDAPTMARVLTATEAWNAAPGDDTLCFIFALTGFYELGLKREGYAFPNARWRNVFAQWLDHFTSLMKQAGLGKDRWMLVLADESGEPELLHDEIPLAEAVKSIDSSIRILSNTSTLLTDPDWRRRFFRAFDVFQPHLGYDLVLDWLRRSGKPLWVYQCRTDLPVMGCDLYSYYRVCPWDMLERGVVGTGYWTYYSAAHDRPWDKDFQGCQFIYLHPDQGLVHSRRYEMAREGFDDYRYVVALRRAAAAKGPDAVRKVEEFIREAVADITDHRQDHRRCEMWRIRIAKRILALRERE